MYFAYNSANTQCITTLTTGVVCTKGTSIKYVMLGGGVGGGWLSGSASRSVTWGCGAGGEGGYMADRYVTLNFNFICLVFSLSIECLVQFR